MTFGTTTAARKTVFAMQLWCTLLGIRDSAMQRKLFHILVLPILSYACKVWAVNPSVSEAAEVLHRGFLKHLLGVRMSTASEWVLAEIGRIPLQVLFWQQVLRYHHRVVALDSRLVKLAMVDGCTLGSDQSVTAATKVGSVGSCLQQHSQQLFHNFAIAKSVIEREKHWFAFKYLHDDNFSSLELYRTLQPEYKVCVLSCWRQCFSNRRLLSRFRSGCLGRVLT